jgi:hypothetical protein
MVPARAEGLARGAAASAAAAPWRARAFGLEIAGDFPAPGLPPATGPVTGPSTRIEIVAPHAINAAWPTHGGERLLEEHLGGRTAARTIDVHPDAGYRLYARDFGLALISPDGALVHCAPPSIEPWRWQQFLVGRVLPWAALLRGFEVFHASAVRVGEEAVAFVGPSGAGKTSLALQLVLRGAGFFADDVLALDRTAERVRAHPGASIAGVRPAERAAIPPDDWRGLGSVLGHSEKTYVDVSREANALPIGAIYYLVRQRDDLSGAIEELAAPDPRMLLASTFVVSMRSGPRLRNQLDVCAALASSARMFTLAVDRQRGAAALADTVLPHARAVVRES